MTDQTTFGLLVPGAGRLTNADAELEFIHELLWKSFSESLCALWLTVTDRELDVAQTNKSMDQL